MNNIARQRTSLGMSQSALAKAIGWGQSRLANYELNSRKPDLESCRKIVNKLNELGGNVTLDDIFPPK
ncbi:repressor [Edwardsiella phage Edno5]|uniref:Repressor n=1 Tax=Edwardsiella phage Edno5 TaxID=2419942 RepID=A0A3G3BYF1_9CAUD|nr:helix-turn-helix transcriptional regulator [Edwardsiella anguillarum]YP_010052864.1 helix-turn-helix transcriptional regulator [Edwardsiella phage Edno5]AKM48219.1 XRE family transcriptional regulator [Edwardsiella sp. EA181011]AYP69240.1 repressor [Edwardsiella phage Edno5]RFT04055.1 XRE family transcriptional regulator [Edwardsiella anguillarum]